ncbi:MAG: nucleotide sugar dehydrogenase [Chitinispirillia bacterium]|jgi:UDP-N-acetyl-D-galactosamine dehydrogenase
MNINTIAVVGLGYVGLPLAVELAKYFTTIGFDINKKRINILQSFNDPNGEVSGEEMRKTSMKFSYNPEDIGKAEVIIVAVPTPIDSHNIPDLKPLVKASEIVGTAMNRNAIIVYESTVFPGATEGVCVKVLEKSSGMKWKKDFFVGYSPERINPGDRVHTFTTITKIVSGDSKKTLENIAYVYKKAVKAGIHKAPSIKVAEAAKVIENTQRDINIALMNELKIIFDKMNISTKEVLLAAKTKWNFLPFEPGLVGGHCIGVDPYYLAYKAEEIGYHPNIIMAGRRINDSMGSYFAREMIKKLIHNHKTVKDTTVLICGITFKEDVPDIRNSKVIDIISELNEFGVKVEVWDPVANQDEVFNEYGISLLHSIENKKYDGVIIAVKHKIIVELGKRGLMNYLSDGAIFYDIKEIF